MMGHLNAFIWSAIPLERFRILQSMIRKDLEFTFYFESIRDTLTVSNPVIVLIKNHMFYYVFEDFLINIPN